jgi:hypothetical protein
MKTLVVLLVTLALGFSSCGVAFLSSASAAGNPDCHTNEDIRPGCG